MSKTTHPIAEAVAALKAFAAALAQRPDVLVDGPYIGGPAPADLIAHHRANPQLLPTELVDLYELMDGFELSWAFRTQPDDEDEEMEDPDGRLLLPPLSDEVRLRTDRENGYTFFGPGTVSVFFDQTQPEFGTWLVAYPPTGRRPDDELADYKPYEATEAEEAAAHATADLARARLLLAYPGDGDPGTLLPYTLAEYLLQAVAHGLVVEWPRDLDGDWPELRQQIARIQASPAA